MDWEYSVGAPPIIVMSLHYDCGACEDGSFACQCLELTEVAAYALTEDDARRRCADLAAIVLEQKLASGELDVATFWL